LTQAQLREQLGSGKSLAQIAQAQGKSVDGLEQAIVDATKKELDQAVADGSLTATQRDEILERLRSHVDKLVQMSFGGGMGRRGGPPGFGFGGHVLQFAGDLIETATSYLGLTQAQLRTQLQSGKSLAQIAQAQGKSVDGLKQAIVNAAKKGLDQAVADGSLTATQRDEILEQLRSHVDELVQMSLGGFGRWGGGPPGFGFRGFEFRGSDFDGFRGFRDEGEQSNVPSATA
jgi:hypothetical protein